MFPNLKCCVALYKAVQSGKIIDEAGLNSLECGWFAVCIPSVISKQQLQKVRLMITFSKVSCVLITSLLMAGYVSAQQIAISSPFNTVSDNYFERVGLDFGFTIPGSPNFRGGDRARGVVGLFPNGQINPNGITFSQGSAGSALPQFGGYDPTNDAHLGFGVLKDGGGFNLNFFGSKGNSRTLTNTTPTIVIPNGGTGTLFNGTMTPFVTSVIPVVGDGAVMVSPIDVALERMQQNGQTLQMLQQQSLDERRQAEIENLQNVPRAQEESTATQGSLSVAEIKRQRSTQKSKAQQEIDDILLKVDESIELEQFASARIYLKQAIRRAEEPLRGELEQRYDQIKDRR
jgi:hypothetical protein